MKKIGSVSSLRKFAVLKPTLWWCSAGWQLLQHRAYIYSVRLPFALQGRFPVLERVMAGQKPSDGTNSRVTQLATHTGNTFTAFSKYKSFNKGKLSQNR